MNHGAKQRATAIERCRHGCGTSPGRRALPQENRKLLKPSQPHHPPPHAHFRSIEPPVAAATRVALVRALFHIAQHHHRHAGRGRPLQPLPGNTFVQHQLVVDRLCPLPGAGRPRLVHQYPQACASTSGGGRTTHPPNHQPQPRASAWGDGGIGARCLGTTHWPVAQVVDQQDSQRAPAPAPELVGHVGRGVGLRGRTRCHAADRTFLVAPMAQSGRDHGIPITQPSPAPLATAHVVSRVAFGARTQLAPDAAPNARLHRAVSP